jgi:hypothetical protein
MDENRTEKVGEQFLKKRARWVIILVVLLTAYLHTTGKTSVLPMSSMIFCHKVMQKRISMLNTEKNFHQTMISCYWQSNETNGVFDSTFLADVTFDYSKA